LSRAGALAVVAVMLLAACGPATSGEDATANDADLGVGLGVDSDRVELATDGLAANSDDIDSVVMIGDSITKGSTPALGDGFDLLGLDADIHAQNGKRMAVSFGDNPSGSSVAEFIAGGSDDHSDELWIVALGTNDIGQYSSPDEIAAAVNEVLDAVPDESALVWVDTYFRDRPEQQDLVNAIIRDRVTRRGNSVVAPWTEFVSGEGVLSSDGVHPSDDGAEIFAFVVTDTTRAFLDR
jgi:lysophospholipase L1-like esterase